ncbi:MAG: hypothetical protein JWM40_1719 [Frankiales bacterium]|nr:hypothetical protein [Frankiales bacterium]
MRIALALLVLLLAVGCKGDSAPAADPTLPPIEGVQSYPGLSNHHFVKGEYPHTYPQSPPVGGPHVDRWLACGAYTETLPNENAVHSLEHGAVWITYQPGYQGTGPLAALTRLNPEYVLVSPYQGQDSPVIVTAWGLQLKLQSSDDPRIVAFVQRYAGGGQGGEQGATCATGGLTPEQALQYDSGLR